MPRTLVRDLRSQVGQTVTVRGWVNSLRLQRSRRTAARYSGRTRPLTRANRLAALWAFA